MSWWDELDLGSLQEQITKSVNEASQLIENANKLEILNLDAMAEQEDEEERLAALEEGDYEDDDEEEDEEEVQVNTSFDHAPKELLANAPPVMVSASSESAAAAAPGMKKGVVTKIASNRTKPAAAEKEAGSGGIGEQNISEIMWPTPDKGDGEQLTTTLMRGEQLFGSRPSSTADALNTSADEQLHNSTDAQSPLPFVSHDISRVDVNPQDSPAGAYTADQNSEDPLYDIDLNGSHDLHAAAFATHEEDERLVGNNFSVMKEKNDVIAQVAGPSSLEAETDMYSAGIVGVESNANDTNETASSSVKPDDAAATKATLDTTTTRKKAAGRKARPLKPKVKEKKNLDFFGMSSSSTRAKEKVTSTTISSNDTGGSGGDMGGKHFGPVGLFGDETIAAQADSGYAEQHASVDPSDCGGTDHESAGSSHNKVPPEEWTLQGSRIPQGWFAGGKVDIFNATAYARAASAQENSFFDKDDDVDLENDPILKQVQINKSRPPQLQSLNDASTGFSSRMMNIINSFVITEPTPMDAVPSDRNSDCDSGSGSVALGSHSNHATPDSSRPLDLTPQALMNYVSRMLLMWMSSFWALLLPMRQYLFSGAEQVVQYFIADSNAVSARPGRRGGFFDADATVDAMLGSDSAVLQQTPLEQLQGRCVYFMNQLWEQVNTTNGMLLLTAALFILSYFKFGRYGTDAGD